MLNDGVLNSSEKRKVCPACGQQFSCKATAAGCWCEEVQLSADARKEISSRYEDCLCNACLAQFANKV